MPDRVTKPKAAPVRIGAKRQPFGFYPADAPTLFVPHPDMWAVHEAGKPGSIAARAGLSHQIFDTWRRYQAEAPWLPDWLYGGDLPPEGRSFTFTAGMHKFREKAQVKVIAEYACRSRDTRWVGAKSSDTERLSAAEIHLWRKRYREKYPEQEWLDHWLLRGQDAPRGIRVITPDEAKRCAAAWDYVSLCAAAELTSHENNYLIWLSRPPTLVPGGPDRLAWLRWLYGSDGYLRAPAYVVSPELQAYRRRGTQRAIAGAAEVSLAAVAHWMREPTMKKALYEAIRAARKQTVPCSDQFNNIDRRARECMIRYAKSAISTARCADESVQLAPNTLYRHMRVADSRGVKQELLDYLNYKGPYKAVHLRRQQGLVNGKLFVIPEAMCAFHKAAVKEWGKQRIAELAGLPGFDSWFSAWVTPKKEESSDPAPRFTSPPSGGRRSRSPHVAATLTAAVTNSEPMSAGATAPSPQDTTGPREVRKTRERNKHLRWLRLHEKSHMSLAEIAQKETDDTGEECTKDAIAKAIKRLRILREQGVDINNVHGQ